MNKSIILPEGVLAPEVTSKKLSLVPTWISEKQLMLMLQRTPPAHVHKRPGKGGGQWDYVTGVYVRKVLNHVFGWLWDFEIVRQDVYGMESGLGQIVVLGKLTVKDGKGASISKTQYGRAEVKYKKGTGNPVDIGNDFKSAATDALKKCASEFGIAGDVYGANEFKEVSAPDRRPVVPVKPVIPMKPEVKSGKQLAKKESAYDCTKCPTIITAQENEFSKKMFKKPLCRKCQIASKPLTKSNGR